MLVSEGLPETRHPAPDAWVRCLRGIALGAALAWSSSPAGSPGAPEAAAGSPEDLLRAADATRRPIEEGSIRIRAEVEVPGETPVVSALEVLVQGEDRALCIFREGPLAGRRVLMVGDRVWLLIPGTARPIPISANQRLLGGASIADVAALRLATEFTAEPRPGEEPVGDDPCRVLDLKAKIRKASYGGGTLWVGEKDGLPRRARFTLPSGKEAKDVRFAQYGRAAGRTVLKRMEIQHLLPSERGMRTTLDFVDYEARSLDPGLFDPAGARDRS
jgi:hypothetical protein